MAHRLAYPNAKNVIGIFNDSFPPILDGVTLTVENYARSLRMSGWNTCVVTPWNPLQIDTGYDVLRYFSLPIASRKPYRYGYPKADPFIWYRLRHTDFRLVHSHCPFSSGRLAVYVKKKQSVPLIGTFHSKYRSDLEHSFSRTPFMVDIIMKRILNFFNACDEVWIPQAEVEATVREYGYKGPLTVMENGNDFADRVDDSDLFDFKSQARRHLGISENEISLLFVGQHIKEKGVDVILEALRLLPDVRYIMNFIGTGYAVEEMRDYIARHDLSDKVHLLGSISDRNRLMWHYAAADLFLFPSFYDNAPLVVREAAAFGTPAVIPAGSTASEVIRDGYNGFLVQRNPEAYAAIVRRIAADRDSLHKQARGARQSLVRGWKSVMDEVLQRYSEIMARYKTDESY